ncbi:UNVERIFIED_CONTAM: hypothetical protein RMT77_019959 [Armadillidium vulgare]
MGAPQRSPVVKGEVPNDEETDQLLSDPKIVKDIVNCIVEPQFDDVKCDPRLKRPHSLAEEFFRFHRCRSCSEQEKVQVNKFLRKMQKKYPWEYNKMQRGILERAEEPLYYDY